MSKKIPDYVRISNLEKENTALKLSLHASEVVNLANEKAETRIHPTAQDEFKRQWIEQHEIYHDGNVVHKLRLDRREVLKDLKRDSFYLFADHVEEAPAQQQASYDPSALAGMSSKELFALHLDELDKKA